MPNLRRKKKYFEIGTYFDSDFETSLKIDEKRSSYSENEQLLQHWLVCTYEHMYKKKIRLCSFRDLRTCTIIGAAIGNLTPN